MAVPPQVLKPVRILAVFLLVSLLVSVALLFPFQASVHLPVGELPSPDYSRYDFGGGEAKVLDLGTVIPSITTPFGEALTRDLVLKKQLATEGWVLRAHPFRSGTDMLPYTDGRLEAMFLGDLPTVQTSIQRNSGIFATARQGYNSVIARHRLTPRELKGLRVGYSPLTSAHFTLERVLATAQLRLADIVSVPLPGASMVNALKTGAVDAVAIWEPEASQILEAIPNASVIARSEAFAFLVLDLDFVARHPSVAQALLAAFVRTTHWFQQSVENQKRGLEWSREASSRLSGATNDAPSFLQDIFHRESIDNPSFPVLPRDLLLANGHLHEQYAFLVRSGYLPKNARWTTVVSHTDLNALPFIMKHSADWQIDRFDYETGPL